MDEDLRFEKQEDKAERREEKRAEKQEKRAEKEERKMFAKLLDEEVEAIKGKDELKIREAKETERQFLEDREFRKAYTKGRKAIEKERPDFFK